MGLSSSADTTTAGDQLAVSFGTSSHSIRLAGQPLAGQSRRGWVNLPSFMIVSPSRLTVGLLT